jgi:hypothetical protein
LSAKGDELAVKFGIRWHLPEDLQAIHNQLGADLVAFNGEDSWTLPMPARCVIGQDGVIAYAEINPDYTRRPEPSTADGAGSAGDCDPSALLVSGAEVTLTGARQSHALHLTA